MVYFFFDKRDSLKSFFKVVVEVEGGKKGEKGRVKEGERDKEKERGEIIFYWILNIINLLGSLNLINYKEEIIYFFLVIVLYMFC